MADIDWGKYNVKVKENNKESSGTQGPDWSKYNVTLKDTSPPKKSKLERAGELAGEFNKYVEHAPKGFAKGVGNFGVNAFNTINNLTGKHANHLEKYPINDYEGPGAFAGELVPGFAPFTGAIGLAGRGAQMIPGIGHAIGSTINALRKIPGASKVENAITSPLAKTAANTGIYSALENPENPGKGALIGALTGGLAHGVGQMLGAQNPLARFLGLAALSGGGYAAAPLVGLPPYMGLAAGPAAKYLSYALAPKNKAAINALSEITPEHIANKAEAKNVLGMDITPAEASKSLVLAQKEGKAGTSEAGKRNIQEFANKRELQENEAVTNALKEISPKEHIAQEEIKKAYDEAKFDVVPINEILKNPGIVSAIKDMQKNSEYKRLAKEFKGKENTAGFLHLARSFLKDKYEKFLKSNESKSTTQAMVVKDDMDELTKAIDDASPRYAQARKLNFEKETRKEIEEPLQGEYSGTNFYNKVLKNQNNYEALQKKLENYPGVQKRLDSMHRIFKDLLDIPNAKNLAKNAREEENKVHGSLSKWAAETLHKLTSGKYDKEYTRIITSPEWDKEFERLNKIKDKQKRAAEFFRLVSKGIGASAATAITPKVSPMELILNKAAGTVPRGVYD